MKQINMNHQPHMSFDTLYREIGHDSEVMVKVGREWLRIRFQKRLAGKDERFELKVTKKDGSFYSIDIKRDAILWKCDFMTLEENASIQRHYRLAKELFRYMA